MGREIRRVPPNWEHPVTPDAYGRERLQPMYRETFEAAFAEWLADFDRIRAGTLEEWEQEYYAGKNGLGKWTAENTPPDPAYYRPWSDEEATWFQVWETVSEGTPVTPPFATKAELVEYLVQHGDFWDQKRGDRPGYSREAAERFVNAGYAPSMVIMRDASGVTIKQGIDAA